MREDEFAEMAVDRSETYKFLALFYNYTALKGIAKKLKDGSFLDGLPPEKKDGGVTLLRKFAAKAKGKDVLEELEVEHTMLFVFPKGTKGRPYESYYLDKEEKVGARITQDVKRFYEAAGAELTNSADELPDFIGMELEFMQFLCSKEAKAWEEKNPDHAVGYLKIEERFINEHLGKWVGDFYNDFHKDARSDFFRGVFKLTEEFTAMEKKDIGTMVKIAEEKFMKKGGKAG